MTMIKFDETKLLSPVPKWVSEKFGEIFVSDAYENFKALNMNFPDEVTMSFSFQGYLAGIMHFMSADDEIFEDKKDVAPQA